MSGVKLKINPEVHLRILQCAECGGWVEEEGATGSESFRGFGSAAIKHLREEHPGEYRECLRCPDDITMAFYIYTERRFEPAEGWLAEEAQSHPDKEEA